MGSTNIKTLLVLIFHANVVSAKEYSLIHEMNGFVGSSQPIIEKMYDFLVTPPLFPK